MKTRKRLLSFLLILTLIMTSLPIQTLAEKTNEIELDSSNLLDGAHGEIY